MRTDPTYVTPVPTRSIVRPRRFTPVCHPSVPRNIDCQMGNARPSPNPIPIARTVVQDGLDSIDNAASTYGAADGLNLRIPVPYSSPNLHAGMGVECLNTACGMSSLLWGSRHRRDVKSRIRQSAPTYSEGRKSASSQPVVTGRDIWTFRVVAPPRRFGNALAKMRRRPRTSWRRSSSIVSS